MMIRTKSNERYNDNNGRATTSSTSMSPIPFINNSTLHSSEVSSSEFSYQTDDNKFPKSYPSPRMMTNNNNNNNSIGNNNNNKHGEYYFYDDEGTSTHPPAAAAAVPPPTKKKKSVHFHPMISIYHLTDVPELSSMMTTQEKSTIWYTPQQYDEFKYDAANCAGVKIIRYGSGDDDGGSASSASAVANKDAKKQVDNKKLNNNNKNSHRFVMVGDFDAKYNNDDDDTTTMKPTNTTTTTSIASYSDGKSHYNENEYNDHHHHHYESNTKDGSLSLLLDGSGEMICKRGLGYHFSRSRKRSRVVTRSVVLAYQRTLKFKSSTTRPSLGVSSNSSDSPLLVGNNNKTQMMLALISTRCSRVAREEARWRGDVDYRVAHPERHTHSGSATTGSSTSIASAKQSQPSKMVKNSSVVGTKRSTAINNNDGSFYDVDSSSHIMSGHGSIDIAMNSCHKRQRTTTCSINSSSSTSSNNNSIRGCASDHNRDELSPTTIGLLAGVLQG